MGDTIALFSWRMDERCQGQICLRGRTLGRKEGWLLSNAYHLRRPCAEVQLLRILALRNEWFAFFNWWSHGYYSRMLHANARLTGLTRHGEHGHLDFEVGILYGLGVTVLCRVR